MRSSRSPAWIFDDLSGSYIFSEYLECLLEATNELGHVAEDFVLVREAIAHLTLKVIHESVSFCRSLLLEIFQELARHVSALS